MILSTHGVLASQIASASFLLDLYPNAAVAYSLRKLRTLYTGNAIRVRRSSDNTEQNIGFTALGNLDTATLLSFCGSGNGFVTTWYDQSGSGKNAIQTTAANQPQIVNGGSILVDANNKPQLTMGGNRNLFVDTSLTINQPFTPIAVAQPLLSAGFEFVFDSTGANRVTTFSFNDQKPAIFAGIALTGSNTHTRAQHLYFSIYNTTNSFLFLDNVQVISGNAGSSNYGNMTLGKPGDSIGKSSEYIFYSSNQSSNRLGIQTNINSYYAIY
jgi:hypothetical protein